ncbi:unnamed protein product, partial [Laminaria digitata]
MRGLFSRSTPINAEDARFALITHAMCYSCAIRVLLMCYPCVMRAKLPSFAFIGVGRENNIRIVVRASLPNDQTQAFEFEAKHLVKLCGAWRARAPSQGKPMMANPLTAA